MRLCTSIPLASAMLVAATCLSAPTGVADPIKPPFPVGQIGKPVQAKSANGATADITLDSASWFPAGCAGGWSCNVVELTITGTSPKPFAYNDIDIVAGYGGGDQPFTHPNDDHWLGADFNVDYTKINKLPPLRRGSVTAGQTAHGFIGYGLQSQGDVYVKFIDPDTETPNSSSPSLTVAGWKVHT
jgi:hypothetical protein